jgi:hypothetical protein
MAPFLALASIVGAACAFATPAHHGVQVIADEARRRVDVTIDGKPFTSYIWPESLAKPTLYPLIDDEGVTVTRGFPLDPMPGERTDHPHQVGMWLNYGNVNGFDFWNNSTAIKPEDRHKMGSVLQTKIVSAKGGPNQGELIVDTVWVSGEGRNLIDETTRYVFTRRDHSRIVDRITTLKPLERIVFKDDKEGLLGIRVASWLESPDEKGGDFLDSAGRPTHVEAGSSSGASGVYLTSEGAKGAAAWGTRARWCLLTGHTGANIATIAIIDHSKNPGYPTYWHARGYGLFAANPLGRSIFDSKQPAFNFTAEKGDEVTFRYRVIVSSQALTAQDVNREADSFEGEYK